MNATKQSAAQPTAKQESATPVAAEVRPLAMLGRRIGNGNLHSWLQAKLTVSNPTDIYEQEADRVADQVMRMPATQTLARAPLQIQRACSKCEEEDKHGDLQRTADGDRGVPTVSNALEGSIAGLGGRGNGLPSSVRSFMESRFGTDFGGVRIHADAHANELARSVDAQAFTVGRNVVFGAGHYAPETEHGKRLLAHELTHVIQQRGADASLQRQPERPMHFGSMARTHSAGSMAQGSEAAKAREQIEKQHWQLPEMERCVLSCRFSSTEARRWYTQAFLQHYYRGNQEVGGQQLDYLLVQYEIRFQQSRSPQEVAMIPAGAGSMGWVDTAMEPKPTIADQVAQAREHERYLNSKEYKIRQRPFTERFHAALRPIRLNMAKDAGGNLADGREHPEVIMEPQTLWDYGVAHDLFVKSEAPTVFGELAKVAAATYAKRYALAIVLARARDLSRPPLADEVLQTGFLHNIFLAEEREQVLKDRQQDLKEIEAMHAKRRMYERRKFESDRYRAWVAQGERLSAAEPFVQPFAFGGFGWIVGAAYGGTQTGMLGVQTYQACVQGQGNCGDAMFQIGVGVATHYAMKGITGPNAPRAPARGVPEPLVPKPVAPEPVVAKPAVPEPAAAPKAPAEPVANAPAAAPARPKPAEPPPQEHPAKATKTPPPNKDFNSEEPTHPELFPESEKTFENDPLPDSHVDDPGDLNIEELPPIDHPPHRPPGSRPTEHPQLPPDDTPGHVEDPVEIEVPDGGARASAGRGSSRGRARVPRVVDSRPNLVVEGFGRKGTKPAAKRTDTIQIGVPGRARQVLPAARQETRQVADFTLLGSRRMRAKLGVRPDPGKILHWRIRTATRNRRVLTEKDVGPLLNALLADARHGAAALLRVSGKLHPKQDFSSLQKLARLLGGDARKLDAANIEMEIPVHPPKAPSGPIEQGHQQQMMGPRRQDPTPAETPKAKQAAASPQRDSDPQLGPIMKAIVYVSGKRGQFRRAIVVVGKKAYYQATGTSKSDIPGQPAYKTPGDWHHFAGIQEFDTEIVEILEQYRGAGRRGWVIKREGMTDLEPNTHLKNVVLDVQFETRVPERVNEWLFDQGADSFIAIEHNGLLEPIEEVESVSGADTSFDGDTQP